MIAQLTGKIIEKDSQGVVLDVSGVGYQVFLSSSCLSSLPEIGEEASLFTYLQVKESGMELFGFLNREEKLLFEKIISISGIGPKLALSILSFLPPRPFQQAILNEDAALLATIPKIGPKNAKRLIVELKEKITISPLTKKPAYTEAREALVNLGYSVAQAQEALDGYAGNGEAKTEDLVKYALKKIASG